MTNALLDLAFEPVYRVRPFSLIAPGLAQHVGSAGDLDGTVVSDAGPVAPYAAIELVVERCTGWVAAGLVDETGEGARVRWSAERQRLSIDVVRQGRSRTVAAAKLGIPGGFGLAFVLCENRVTALVDSGTGWRPVVSERRRIRRGMDFRRAEVLARQRFSWQGSRASLSSVRAGPYGMAGLRDPHLVQHASGTPYVRDGRHYLTWTCAGLGFFQQAHWSVWSMDLDDPEGLRLESLLFSRRDGLILGDHAGHLVRDGDHWLLATSSWGDFGEAPVHLRTARTRADLLTGVHVIDTEPVPLPTELAAWDPGLTRIDEAWHVTFVESASQDPFLFHAVLARTESAIWTDGLRRIASADDLDQCEGPSLVRSAGGWNWVAGDGAAREFPVFDLAGNRLGFLDAPFPSNIPHPQLVQDRRGAWLLITFDGTPYGEDVLGYGTHGDVVVLRSQPRSRREVCPAPPG